MGKEYVVAVMGATGAVGQEMMQTLEKTQFSCKRTKASRIGTVKRKKIIF